MRSERVIRIVGVLLLGAALWSMNSPTTTDAAESESAGEPLPNVPQSMTVQGRLTDAAGVPITTGPVDLSFSIWTFEVGGVKVWPSATAEVHTVNPDPDGLWHATLGTSYSFLSVNPFDGAERWLNIIVDDGVNPPVALPRTRLQSVPYAQRVESIDGAKGGVIDGHIGIGVASAFYPVHISATGQSVLHVTNTQITCCGSGVFGQTSASTGAGISGLSVSNVPGGAGVRGRAIGDSCHGVEGHAQYQYGRGAGVYGSSGASVGSGVYGEATSDTGATAAIRGHVSSGAGFGAYLTGPAGSQNYFQRSVGIGTVNPLAELHLSSEVGNADFFIKRSDALEGFNIASSATPKLFIARSNGSTYNDILTIDGSSDNVGIGTTAPDCRLEVRSLAGSDALRVRVDTGTKLLLGSNGGLTVGVNSPAPANGLFVAGNVGLGLATTSFQLELATNSAAKPTSNTWTVASDERLKTDIQPIRNALRDLLALRGVTYRWRDPNSHGGMDGTYTGLIAQNVEEVFPEWISEDEQGYKHLTVTGFEGLVVEALRELQAENNELRQRLQTLEEQLLRKASTD